MNNPEPTSNLPVYYTHDVTHVTEEAMDLLASAIDKSHKKTSRKTLFYTLIIAGLLIVFITATALFICTFTSMSEFEHYRGVSLKK